jgi:hypothetical protein
MAILQMNYRKIKPIFDRIVDTLVVIEVRGQQLQFCTQKRIGIAYTLKYSCVARMNCQNATVKQGGPTMLTKLLTAPRL